MHNATVALPCQFFVFVFFWIHEPPKFLTEMRGIVANSLYIVQIFCGYARKDKTHSGHGNGFYPYGHTFTHARRVEAVTEVFEKLPPFCLSRFFYQPLEVKGNMLHVPIVL